MKVGVKMDLKLIKYIMFGIFIILLLRFFLGEDFFRTSNNKDLYELSGNPNLSVEVYKEDKNGLILRVKAEYLKKLKEENERASFRESRGNQPTYWNLYPDLYVEGIKPIIVLEEKKIAYLTFDDGPSENTWKILDILKEHNVKATFFVLGGTANEEEKECLKVMAQDGHTIGIHTYSHNYKMIYSSVEGFLDDFNQAFEMIYETTGVKPSIFRFPWGSVNSYNKNIRSELIAEMERRGFTYYDWNVDSRDSVGTPSEYRIKKNISKGLEKYNNPIILLHDASVNKQTVKILPAVIEMLKDAGFEFDTLEHREPYHF